MLSKVKTQDGTENIRAYTWSRCQFGRVAFSKMTRAKTVKQYCNEYATLDTETSHSGDTCGWVYQWAVKFNGAYIYGRKPSEIIKLLERMRDVYHLTDKKKIIIYVHNLSYDLQYLKHYLKGYDPKINFMAIDNHTFLICDVVGFRFLCSYKLSNMSLDLFSRSYASIYRKAVGEINYNVVRYQNSKLTAKDWFYMFSDVASQHDAIAGYLKVNGYSYAWQAPFTSTGFVRVDSRHASERAKWRQTFQTSALDLEQYNLCRAAFMGGATIANWQYAGQCVNNVRHKDFTSSYPARQMMDYFPVGKPSWYGDIESMDEFRFVLDNYCTVFILHADKVQIKAGITAPYIPSSKCFWLKGDLRLNGKLVYADEIAIALTEIDYKIIEKQYTFENVRVDHVLIMARGRAPGWLRAEVMKLYRIKCTMKKADPMLYAASKAKLNAVYGMSATAIIRDQYTAGDDLIIAKEETHNEQTQIDKFYRSYNSFMPYQLGVYTTAHARAALFEMIEAVGYDNFLYCDTDSVFYIANEESEKRLAAMNERIKQRAIAAGAYVDNNFLGVATDEPDISVFKALHAKCYAAVEKTESGEKLNVTIAGIPKRSTKWIDGQPVTKTNAEELGDIDSLKDGFIFRHCGGTRIVYVEDTPHKAKIDGHVTEWSSSAIIENIEKEISDTMFTVGKDYSILDIKQEQFLY